MHTLYADENVPKPVIDRLRAVGYDIRSVVDDGRAGQQYPDRLVLQRAAELGRVLLTHDRRDFRRLHGQGAHHAGILLATQDRDANGLAARIHAALSSTPAMRDQVINVYRPANQPRHDAEQGPRR